MAATFHGILAQLLLASTSAALAVPHCKTAPFSPNWPSPAEWSALNDTIGGSLISTTPVASTCWPGNPFNSQLSCNITSTNWTSSIFHQELPESIGKPLFANNSCLPPGSSGYLESSGCRLGGLPSYIVNATTEEQIADAMKWASFRGIRIVVKGTGHDLNGRSSGSHALSIWTRHLNSIKRDASWRLPASPNKTEDVFIIGSGVGWGDVLTAALQQNRIVTTGQDPSVGPGGYISGGGHGPLSSTYGLAAQQVLQVRVVTTEGKIMVANACENQDMFWAIRGGGGGLYGVVTEFVIRHFPAPAAVNMATLKLAPIPAAGEMGVNASWDAAAILFQNLPDLMDAGVAGAMTMASGGSVQTLGLSSEASSGVALQQVFWVFNTTASWLDATINPIVEQMRAFGDNSTLSISYSSSAAQNYTSFYKTISGSGTAGGGGVSASRLLGKKELVDVPSDTLKSYLRRSLVSQNATAGTFATIGLSGGPGVISTPPERWGSLIPSWRSAYLHFLVGGASGEVSDETSPKELLAANSQWIDENKEEFFREWAPEMGAYMNEANPYNSQWQKDFYGSSYAGLLDVKKKYDPTESLFVLTGVGSDGWEYDLQTGMLCRV